MSARARVHRFHDKVALFTADDDGDGKTIYLEPNVAAELAVVLSAYAYDTLHCDFGKSGSHYAGTVVPGELEEDDDD